MTRPALALFVAAILAVPLASQAGESAANTDSRLDASVRTAGRVLGNLIAAPQRAAESIERVRSSEAVEMLSAILSGSQMGPGDGWFHGSQSRYSWNWLVANFDLDQNGGLSDIELAGLDSAFARLDRNRDGTVAQDDFDWTDRSPFVRQTYQISPWFRQLDITSNGRISYDEWQEFFSIVASEKGYVTPDDLREALIPPPPRSQPQQASGGPTPFTLIKGLFNGEIGSFHEGPALGEPAPDFALKTRDGGREIRLSDYRNQRPVVLIFGSFT